jgi:hypothetical protein
MEGVVTLARRRVWAQQQFGAAQLGDARRTRRLVKLATQMAANSSGSIPQQTGNTADMKAAYRLFAAENVTHAAILQPHLEQTRARASTLAQVFLVQDTAELSFTNHVHCEGLGPIGPSSALQGLHQQNVLAIDPQTQRPLGLMYQRHHRRQSRPAGHSHDRTATRKVPLEERESHWWVEAIRTIGSPPAGVRWIHVGDRGEDIFGVYQEAQRQGTDWLIRAARDRRVQTPTGETHLMSYARHLPSIATRRLNVRTPSGGTRPAVLQVAAGRATLLPVRYEREYRGGEPLPCWVVRSWESPPPAESAPLEWILLTSLSGETPAAAIFAAEGYSLRWLIEEFHKCEKTGCQVEARCLTHTDRLEPLIALLSVLAVWLLTLKYAARDEPERPACECFDATMVAVMARYLRRPAPTLTLADFWRGIGRLGGHLGRKRDGPLGWLRAWRGWQSFQLILLGAELYGDRDASNCG